MNYLLLSENTSQLSEILYTKTLKRTKYVRIGIMTFQSPIISSMSNGKFSKNVLKNKLTTGDGEFGRKVSEQ